MTINDEENISAKDSDLLVMFSFLFSNKKQKQKLTLLKINKTIFAYAIVFVQL